MADYNYNYDSVPENDFDQSYGQNLLRRSRPAKIVSPMGFLNQPKYTSFRNGAIKRNNEEKPVSNEKEEKSNKSESTKKPSGNNNAEGIGKVADKIASGKKAATVAETFLKAKKMKLLLIGGGIFFGLIFIFMIFFTVFVSSGTEITGGSFIEVSDYELNTNDSSTNTASASVSNN